MESHILKSPMWKHHYTSSAWMTLQLPVYRGIGCFTLALWCWGACLYCWEVGRVNYLYIFEFDERDSRSFGEVFDWATSWTQWFLLNFLLFFKALHGVNPVAASAAVYPLALYFSIFAVLVGSSTTQHMRFMAQTLRRIVTSPFAQVTFWDSFAADALTSLVQPMTDIAYSTCYFATGEFLLGREDQGQCESSPIMRDVARPLIAALPLWWRLCQNLHQYNATHSRFPWLVNGLKYATSLTVVVFGVFHPQIQRRGALTSYRIAYFCAFCGSTLFSFTWDVLMDWKLFDVSSERRTRLWFLPFKLPRVSLREKRMYSGRTPYYVAMTLDLFLRFMWTTTLIPSPRMLKEMPTFYSAISPFTASAEVCRRAMWSMLRVESEHLHTEGFRRVQVVPLHFDEDNQLSIQRDSKEAYVAQQKRSKLLVISEIMAFAVLVALIATTAVVTRSQGTAT